MNTLMNNNLRIVGFITGIFLGDAFYFFYGILVPRWHNAFGQLLSFLAYDLVLIFPFLALFSTVKSDHRLSLIIYVAALLYSGLLAIYYLLLHRQTRGQKGDAFLPPHEVCERMFSQRESKQSLR